MKKEISDQTKDEQRTAADVSTSASVVSKPNVSGCRVRPILFSTPMVKAILEGRKTQTRRIIKSNHESGLFMVGRRKSDGQITEITSLDWDERSGDVTNDIHCKYKVGDILWVKWKPSIFMPYQAARIFLKVTNIRVDKLQDISEKDAINEGVLIDDEGLNCYDYERKDYRFITPEQSFDTLWCSINGQESWDKNPFVWVIEFERCERPVDSH